MKYITTSLIFAFFALLAFRPADAQYAREENHEFRLSPGGKVSLDTYQGSISVHTWDKPMVRVSVRIVSNGDYSGAEKDVESTGIIIANNGSRLHLETEKDESMGLSSVMAWLSGKSSRQPLVHYRITMPRTASLEIDDYKSRIAVYNLLSNAAIDTYKGNIRIANVSGHIKIDTYKGTFQVDDLTGGIDVDTYKGAGRVEFAAFLHASKFDTYKGNVAITIPAKTGFNLEADLHRRGALDSDIHFTNARNDEFRGKVNGGGPLLSLETIRGKFAVRKSY